MTLSGLLSSWATPETSWPSADIFAAWTSCAWVSCRRCRLSRALAYRRAFSTAGGAAQAPGLGGVAEDDGRARIHQHGDAPGEQLADALGVERGGELAPEARGQLGGVAPPRRPAGGPRG